MSENTEASLTAAIIKTYGGVQSQAQGVRYVVAAQVNNGAGFSFGRTLDAIVFDTWPSKGLSLAGFEIKCSKGDLRRELQTPDKFEEFKEYLDTFSVLAPKEVLEGMRDVIPSRWGIYSPTDDGRIRAARKPLYLHDDGRDRSVCDRSLAAAFARALVQRSLSREAEDAAYQLGKEAAEGSAARAVTSAEDERDRIKRRIEDFQDASGLILDDYFRTAGKVGEAVKFVMAGGLDAKLRHADDMRNLGNRLIAFAAELDELQGQLEFNLEAIR
jgi:hypothetical protein